MLVYKTRRLQEGEEEGKEKERVHNNQAKSVHALVHGYRSKGAATKAAAWSFCSIVEEGGVGNARPCLPKTV